MGQQTRFRRQSSMALTAFGTKTILQLGRGMMLRELVLRLAGTLTYAMAAQNIASTLGRGDEWSCIAKVEVIANGTDVLRSFTGPQLRMLNRLLTGAVGRVGPQLGDGATAAPTVDSVLIMPFWQPLCIKPLDTVLDTSKVSDLRLEVTTDTAANINTANGPTAIALTLDVNSYESFGISGEFSDCRMYGIQSVLAGANAALQIPLPVGPMYRGFILNAANGAAADSTDLPNAITNVKLVSGSTVFRDIAFPVLRDWQRQRLGWGRELIQNAAAGGALSLTADLQGNTNTSITQQISKSALCKEDAWAFMDLVQDGYLGEAVDSIGFSELFLELNVAAAATLTVIPIQIYPRRAAKAA